jgi:hypothetical protein
MSPTEKFEEQKLTFSDQKIIAKEIKSILKNIRFGGEVDIVIIGGFSICMFLKIKPFIIYLILLAILTITISIIRTFIILRKEFQEKTKLVGTFKIINKKSVRGINTFETKFDYLRINNSFYSNFNINDVIKVDKLYSGRVIKVELLLL